MANHDSVLESGVDLRYRASKIGYFIAIATSGVTFITFLIAILTPPLSGPFCTENCFEYPYLDIISRFPRDYYWMYPAMLLMLLFTGLMVCIHHFARESRRVFSLGGLAFGIIATLILFVNYFVQVSVIQPSLLSGEIDGIPLLTQYNPHGIFIALEEAGYIMMSLSLFSIAPVFSGSRLQRSLRWLFSVGFFLTVISFIVISSIFGSHREYYFEVAAITINWTILIIGSFLTGLVFRRNLSSA